MHRDQRMRDLFEDLEQQAEGLRLAERDAEIVDRFTSEYAEVTFAARIHASTSLHVRLEVQGAGTIAGTLSRAGRGWCLLEGAEPGRDAIIRLPAVQSAQGLSERAVSEVARSAVTRLGLGSVLRRVSESGSSVVLTHLDGRQSQGLVLRVGADFAEVDLDEISGGRAARTCLVPFDSLAAIHAR